MGEATIPLTIAQQVEAAYLAKLHEKAQKRVACAPKGTVIARRSQLRDITLQRLKFELDVQDKEKHRNV